MSGWLPYLLVGVGGFLGANARFVLARAVGQLVETRFPLGTFLVNVSGCFLLGLLGTIFANRVSPDSESLRIALGVGFLGAYTTFSTFSLESHLLLQDKAWLAASANTIGSLLVGLLALRGGIVAARALVGRSTGPTPSRARSCTLGAIERAHRSGRRSTDSSLRFVGKVTCDLPAIQADVRDRLSPWRLLPACSGLKSGAAHGGAARRAAV